MNSRDDLFETYQKHGVAFEYPGFWDLSEELAEDEDQVRIQINSPGTTFWSLTLLFDSPLPKLAIESVAEAFRQEYQEIDLEEIEQTVCDCPGLACTIEFVCFDLISTAFVNAFRTADFTALLLAQGADIELEETRELLDLMTGSLRLDGSH